MEGVIFGGILAFGLAFAQVVHAQPECSMDKWSGGATVPANAVGSPQSASPVARYSEFCGLAVSAGASGYVQSPATSDAHYFGRFYAHLGATGGTEANLLVAYDGDDNPVVTVSYDGTNLNFDTANGGSGSAPAEAGKWNLVEFEFNSGGDFNVWVNQDWDFVGAAYDSTTIASFASGTGTITYVRLGAPNGMGGFTGAFTFDAFEAHRTTNVGALRACDAEGDSDVDINDVLAVVDEVFADPVILSSGQPDCDSNGSVNINDALAIVDLVF